MLFRSQELDQFLASEAKVRVNITAMLDILEEQDLVEPLLISDSHSKSAASLLAFDVKAPAWCLTYGLPMINPHLRTLP